MEFYIDRATLAILITFSSFAGGYYAIRLRKPADPND